MYNKMIMFLKNNNFKLLSVANCISVYVNYYQYSYNNNLNDKLEDVNYKLEDVNYKLEDMKIYKNFVIDNKLMKDLKEYENDIDTYKHFQEVGGIYYKPNIKDKYYICDSLFGEIEFNLPSKPIHNEYKIK